MNGVTQYSRLGMALVKQPICAYFLNIIGITVEVFQYRIQGMNGRTPPNTAMDENALKLLFYNLQFIQLAWSSAKLKQL